MTEQERYWHAEIAPWCQTISERRQGLGLPRIPTHRPRATWMRRALAAMARLVRGKR